MNTNTRHPGVELLDQLHAGLLDDQEKLKLQLETHLQQCEQCQQTTNWRNITDHTEMPAQLENRLESITRKALSQAQRPKPTNHLIPVAAAASVIALLTATLLFNPARLNTDLDPAIQAQAEPENIYEDLDFYLWMADQKIKGRQSKQDNDLQG